MEQASSRLPVVREPRYLATRSPMQTLAVTAKRGAALMAAGAVARVLLKHAAAHLLKSGTQVAVRKPVQSPAVQEDAPAVVEEVVYFRRRFYRRSG